MINTSLALPLTTEYKRYFWILNYFTLFINFAIKNLTNVVNLSSVSSNLGICKQSSHFLIYGHNTSGWVLKCYNLRETHDCDDCGCVRVKTLRADNSTISKSHNMSWIGFGGISEWWTYKNIVCVQHYNYWVPNVR